MQRPRPDRVDDVAHARELDGRRRHDVHGRECLGLDSAQVVFCLIGAECIGELGAVDAVQRELAVGFTQEFGQGLFHVLEVAQRHAGHAMHQEAGHRDVKPPEVGGLKRRTWGEAGGAQRLAHVCGGGRGVRDGLVLRGTRARCVEGRDFVRERLARVVGNRALRDQGVGAWLGTRAAVMHAADVGVAIVVVKFP